MEESGAQLMMKHGRVLLAGHDVRVHGVEVGGGRCVRERVVAPYTPPEEQSEHTHMIKRVRDEQL